MTGFSFEGRVMADLGAQVAALRDDLACLTAQARRDATRVVELETALRLVRDLMRDLPAHDNVATVAVRLRAHFDYLAAQVIDDALAAPLRDAPIPEDAEEGRSA